MILVTVQCMLFFASLLLGGFVKDSVLKAFYDKYVADTIFD